MQDFLKSENIHKKNSTDNPTEILQILVVLIANLDDYLYLCPSEVTG